MKRLLLISLIGTIIYIDGFGQKKAALAPQINPYSYTVSKNLECKNGAVVSAHALASKAGVMMLQQGGNAVDAAIATQLALAVVYPGAGNIGGGGFFVGHFKKEGNVTIDFREKAPGKATRDMYLDAQGNALTNLSVDGHLAAGVPGTIAGLFASAKYGKLPFKTLIQPAIDLAEKGFVITAAEAANLNNTQTAFKKQNTVMPVFVKEAHWKAGDTLVQKDLAKTLIRIREGGQKGFYEGETAKLIVEEMKRGNGIISYEDLKTYQAAIRQPVVFPYRDYTIVTMPLPSSGGILLPMMLKMAATQPLKSYGFESLKAVH